MKSACEKDDETLALTAGHADGEPGKAAFTELVYRYQDAVFRMALGRLGRTEPAREAAQETFMIAWRRLGEWKPKKRFVHWLMRIALNVIRGIARKEGREKILAPDVAPPVNDPPGRIEQDENREGLWILIRALPEKQAEALVLHYVLDWPLEQVARMMGCATGTVKSHLHRARGTLRMRLMEEGRS